MEEGEPTSKGVIIEAAELCATIVIILQVEKPCATYLLGWGDKLANAKLICCTCKLTVVDVSDQPVTT